MVKQAMTAFAVGLVLLVSTLLGGCSYEKVDEIWTDGQDYLVAVDRDVWRKVVQDGRASGVAAELLRRANELLDADGPVQVLAAQSSLSGRSLVFAAGERSVKKLYLVRLETDGRIESGSIARPKEFHGFCAVGDACFTLFADRQREKAGPSFVLTGGQLTSGEGCQTGEAVSIAFEVDGQTTPGKFIVQSTEHPTEWRVELAERTEVKQFFIAPDNGVAAIVGPGWLSVFQRHTGKKLGSFRTGASEPFLRLVLSDQLIVWTAKEDSWSSLQVSDGFARRDVDSRWRPIQRDRDDFSVWRVSPSRRWVTISRWWPFGVGLFADQTHWSVERLPVNGAPDPPTRPRILSRRTIWLAR